MEPKKIVIEFKQENETQNVTIQVTCTTPTLEYIANYLQYRISELLDQIENENEESSKQSELSVQ